MRGIAKRFGAVQAMRRRRPHARRRRHPRPPRRERRRQDQPDERSLRHLCRRRRHDRGRGQAGARSAAPPMPWRSASAWCTSISTWCRATRFSRTCWSAAPGRTAVSSRRTGSSGSPRSAAISTSSLDPDRLVGDLSVGEQQRVEIAKSLVRGARILVLDEPTATLTPRESDGLFAALRAMAAQRHGRHLHLAQARRGDRAHQQLVVMRHGARRRRARAMPATCRRPRSRA